MAAKSDTKSYYEKPEVVYEPKHHYIMWHPPRFFSNKNILFPAHGMEFRSGTVYRVSPDVYEWAKRQRGFYDIIAFETHKLVEFKGKNEKNTMGI